MGRGAGKRRPWQQLGGGSQKIKLAALTEAAGRSCIRSGNVDENWTRLKRGAGLGFWEPGVGTAVVGRPPKTRAGVPPPPAARPRPIQGPELGLQKGMQGALQPGGGRGSGGGGAPEHRACGLADGIRRGGGVWPLCKSSRLLASPGGLWSSWLHAQGSTHRKGALTAHELQ